MAARLRLEAMTSGRIGKWILVAGGGAVGLSLLGIGGWYWRDASHSAGRAALQPLGDALARYPRHPAAPEAAYLLGNLHYRAQSFEAARAAFQAALRAGARGSLAQLCRLGIGYTWEGQGEHAAALTAYQELLAGAGPADFLYEEALVASARTQELLQQRAQALETYRRLLRDLPRSRRAEEARSRLASLEGPSRP